MLTVEGSVIVTVFENCYHYDSKTFQLLPILQFYRGNCDFTMVTEVLPLLWKSCHSVINLC